MTLSSLSSLLDQQLRIHGYHLTDDELRDVAAQVLQCIEPAPALRHQIDELQAKFTAWVDGLRQWRPSDKEGSNQ